jgi:hypothetical protein
MYFNKIAYLIVISCFTLVTMDANAIPAFARKNNMSCSGCHTAWPALNAFGRQYKEHGYRVGHLEAPKITISKDLKWDENLPVSVVIVGRPYDKKDSGDTKNRAVHEVELMVAGPMGEKFSSFFEIEAEDEVTNGIGFDTGIPAAAFTYNHNEAVNVQLSWGSNTWFDPYDNYSANRRLTRGTNAVIDQGFGGADNGGKLKSSRQNIAIYGRPIPKLFYGVASSGDAGDEEGVEGNTVTARVAFDVMPYLTIGAMYVNGTANASSTPDRVGIVGGVPDVIPGSTTPERDYTRSAIDVQAEVSNFLVINAAYVQATDDNSTATADEDNNAYYAQAMYTVKEGNRTTWAPLFRFDSYEKNDGADTINEMTLGVSYYFTENVRAMAEFWDRSGDGTTADDDRLTVQVFAAF